MQRHIAQRIGQLDETEQEREEFQEQDAPLQLVKRLNKRAVALLVLIGFYIFPGIFDVEKGIEHRQRHHDGTEDRQRDSSSWQCLVKKGASNPRTKVRKRPGKIARRCKPEQYR